MSGIKQSIAHWWEQIRQYQEGLAWHRRGVVQRYSYRGKKRVDEIKVKLAKIKELKRHVRALEKLDK